MLKRAYALGLCEVFSTFFYVGFIPKAPGTWGSIAGFLLLLLLSGFLSKSCILFLILLLFFAGLVSSHVYSKARNVDDPSEVVVDEVVGMMMASYPFLGHSVKLVASFFLFRMFDILKPFPVRDMEKLKGGLGIMMDDIVASLYSILVLFVLGGLNAV